MKKKALVLLGLTLFLWSAVAWAGSIRAYFSPDGGCTGAIVQQINHARQEILIQAYSFTSKPIARALMGAQQRGVAITALMDKSNEIHRYVATLLNNAGIRVYIDDKHAIAHNKIMIIDNHVLITGSFNFTRAAEHDNAENLLILDNVPDLIQAYRQNFQKHLRHSVAYVARTDKERSRRKAGHLRYQRIPFYKEPYKPSAGGLIPLSG